MTQRSVRRATEVDAPELLRLRVVMLDSMGIDTGPEDAAWREHGIAVFEARLSDRDRFAAFVIDAPNEQLAACAVCWIDRHLPGPKQPNGDSGMMANVATDPRFRKQGYGTAVVAAADEWLSQQGLASAYLYATDEGAPLYRALAWGPTNHPSMVKRYR